MTYLLRIAAMLGMVLTSSAAAQDGPVVVELFTSQGCSSCPPADDMLSELSGRDDVIALALHVDYWDYIGWVDEFADPLHTRRQQAYAREAGRSTVYTPQFIIEGRQTVIGAKSLALADAIMKQANYPDAVSIALTRTGDTLSIQATANAADGTPYLIQLAKVTPEETVDIKRGENAGRTMTYSNVVRSLDLLHEWDGTAPVGLSTDVGGYDLVAVVVQQGVGGPIVGAAKLAN